MTDYNKQRPDDERPSSRPQAPNNRYGEQRSSGPARPRLNRESVDRAWESGAPSTHADYRPRNPRGNNIRPSQNTPQGNWRNAQQSEHSSAPNGRRSFDNRQDHPRPDRPPYTPHTPSSSEGPRPRSFNTYNNTDNTSRPRFDDRRNDRPNSTDRPHSNGPNNGPRPNFRPQPNNNQRPPYRENDRYQGTPPRNSERDERQPREFERDQRPPRKFDRQPGAFNRDNRPPRGNERRGEPGRFERDNRPARYPQANMQNPRWQSRPGVQGEQHGPDGQHEQFEGDYERFDGTQRRERPITPYRPNPGKERPVRRDDQSSTEEERHVTRLPDGRVLKGPRTVQRRDAEFWTEVADESAQLVKPLHDATSPAEEIEGKQPTEGIEGNPPIEESGDKGTLRPEKKAYKPRTRVASSVARAKKPRTKKGESKPPSKGPKPSQKGYKWPTT
jgi:hypothetical protein